MKKMTLDEVARRLLEKRVEELAQAKGMSVDEFVRRTLEEALERYETDD